MGVFLCRKIINVKKRGICYTIFDMRSCTGIINGRETGYYDGNYQEQYNQELHQQEINSNLRTLKGYFWIIVTMLVLWLLTLMSIFIVDAGIFTMAVGLSMVMGIPVLYIYKVDLSKHWVKYVFFNI